MQNQQHEVERAAASGQQAQTEMYRYLNKALKQMMENLAKAFGKGDGKDTEIEIKVNGETKLKGKVKDGVFTASKNTLTADEVESLKKYFASLPNPALKPKDFEVLVDKKTVLQTKDGAVVSQATPSVTATQAEQAKQAFSAINSPPNEAAQAAPRPAKITEPVQATVPERTAAPAAKPVPPVAAATPNPAPSQAQSRPAPTPTPRQEPSRPAAQSQTPAPTPTPTAPTQQTSSTDHPLIPDDFGIPAAKGITWDKVKATGDPLLIHGYGGLENIRADLNDSYKRSNAPGYEWIRKAPHVAPLEGQLETAKQNFEARLTECIKQGKYPAPDSTTQSHTQSQGHEPSAQEKNNIELLKDGKGAIALLSNAPAGEREFHGKNYSMQEGKDGSFRITEQDRGEILSFSNGKLTGKATAQDVATLKNLLDVAQKTHLPEQSKNNAQTASQGKSRTLTQGGVR